MKKSKSTEKKNKSNDVGLKGLPFLLGGLFIILWQLAVDILKIQPYILPGPVDVMKALYKERILLLSHTIVTLSEALIGFGIAVVLGVVLGILMGYYNIIRRMFYPLFVISQTIPLIVLTPLFAIWFGFGLLPKVLIIILGCFFPITVAFTQSLLKTDEDMDELLSVMGASRWKSFLLVRIPQALPGLFAGLRIAVTYSIMGAVISEWVGAQKGLGIYMTRAMTSFKTAVLFA
ncbi:MAG: ABC transporter permease, partial [Acetivibrionales bacterium]